ncbi:MerR family transcriptional regulator [Nocardia higoensis]|uniref:MerR family transcriptional regulator n=1 Tax=Nocardia higoensis TaxID=228599 RepID=A0ABS0D5F4_9NOCA|nr:MerR family transcriptional regulator [Nocardia higoensis]MBF6353043.1 MerR family transcriptional regulator [Nocardia higoensis]
MLIGELETRTGVGRHALRYYERRGLLGEIGRTAGNYRDYPEGLVEQIRLLRSMQSLGFSLSEIGQVMNGVRARDIDCADGAALLAAKRSRVDEQIVALRALSEQLAREQRHLEKRARRHGKVPGRPRPHSGRMG